MSLAQYSKEELSKLSLIEMAYEYLKNSKQPIAFKDLVNEIAAAAGYTEEEIRSRLAQFYTDVNVDGRFLSLGENRWGLRVWYPVDTAEEEVVTSAKPKKKKAKKIVDEDEIEDLEDYEELDDEDYEELDEFDDEDDLLDEDEDFEEVDDVEEFDNDALEEDEEFDLEDEDDLDDDEDDELDEEDDEEDL